MSHVESCLLGVRIFIAQTDEQKEQQNEAETFFFLYVLKVYDLRGGGIHKKHTFEIRFEIFRALKLSMRTPYISGWDGKDRDDWRKA